MSATLMSQDSRAAKIALVILSRNQGHDFHLLNRLLSSLSLTDFPRSYTLYLIVDNETYQNDATVPANRRWALAGLVDHHGYDWFLYLHNDVYFTGRFWEALVASGAEIVLAEGVNVNSYRIECFVAMKRAFLLQNVANIEKVLVHGHPSAVTLKIPMGHKD